MVYDSSKYSAAEYNCVLRFFRSWITMWYEKKELQQFKLKRPNLINTKLLARFDKLQQIQAPKKLKAQHLKSSLWLDWNNLQAWSQIDKSAKRSRSTIRVSEKSKLCCIETSSKLDASWGTGVVEDVVVIPMKRNWIPRFLILRQSRWPI